MAALFTEYGEDKLQIICFTTGGRFIIAEDQRAGIVFDDTNEIIRFDEWLPKEVTSCWQYSAIDGLIFSK